LSAYRVSAGSTSHWASKVFAIAVAAVVGTSAALSFAHFAESQERPVGLRATIALPSGWLPLQCKLSDGELGGIASNDAHAAIVFAHTTREALSGPDPEPDCGLRQLLVWLISEPLCGAASSPPISALEDFSWRTCQNTTNSFAVGTTESRGQVEIAVVVYDLAHPTRGTGVVDALETLSFS
jgi:hypothetical protein